MYTERRGCTQIRRKTIFESSKEPQQRGSKKVKSFLLLFFKKEDLSCVLLIARYLPRRKPCHGNQGA
jgi:hypothetical protein